VLRYGWTSVRTHKWKTTKLCIIAALSLKIMSFVAMIENCEKRQNFQLTSPRTATLLKDEWTILKVCRYITLLADTKHTCKSIWHTTCSCNFKDKSAVPESDWDQSVSSKELVLLQSRHFDSGDRSIAPLWKSGNKLTYVLSDPYTNLRWQRTQDAIIQTIYSTTRIMP
jgi:hypothetical protein